MDKRKKVILLLCLIILLLIISIYCIFIEKNYSNFDYNAFKNEIVLNREENKNLFSNMQLNNEFCSYDSDSDTCFFNFDKENKFTKLNIRMYLINDDVMYATNSGINVSRVFYDFSNDNEILLYNQKYYYVLNVKFLSIPIVNITNLGGLYRDKKFNFLFDEMPDLRDDVNMVFSLYSSDSRDYINSFGTYHVRGASSFLYDKKSYRFDLNDNYGILSMKSDSDWILDAVYADESKIRNKLSSDMWNLINDNQYINNDMNGEFVELFVNRKYMGLYNLKEDIDAKRFGVTDDGVIIKSISHLSNANYNNILFNNISLVSIGKKEYVENFEIKKHTQESLDSIFNRLSNYLSSTGKFDIIDNNFYIDNYINYKIFVSLIMGNDNLTKNQIYSMEKIDSKILITPWDMDLSWGLSWSDTHSLHCLFSMESSYDIEWMDNNITNNMDNRTLSLLKDRYWSLRRDVITMTTINNFLDSYEKLFVDSGVSERDGERWYKYDVEFEIEQIREWARRRIEFLDEYFK